MRTSPLRPAAADATRHARLRVLDTALAAALLVLFAPLLAGVALMLRAEGGPALVKRRRRNRAGHWFAGWHFRTGRLFAAAQPAAGLRGAPTRPSRVGAIVARVGMADLPLLANVLAGDLSLAELFAILMAD